MDDCLENCAGKPVSPDERGRTAVKNSTAQRRMEARNERRAAARDNPDRKTPIKAQGVVVMRGPWG